MKDIVFFTALVIFGIFVPLSLPVSLLIIAVIIYLERKQTREEKRNTIREYEEYKECNRKNNESQTP